MKIIKLLLPSLAGLVLAIAPTAAQAQPEPTGDEVELGDEPLPDDDGDSPGGAEENPNAPVTLIEDTGDDDKAAPVVEDGPYPISVAARPLTLHAGMSEVGLGLRASFDPVILNGALHADYGVTREVQLGLRYSPGALIDGEFETGKAVAVEARYLIKDWISAQVAVPVLLDPFGIAIEAGAPIKFRFDKFALFAGENLLAVKIYRLIPNATNTAYNAGQVALDATNTTLAAAELRFIGGVIYQLDDAMALTARAGLVTFIDGPSASDATRLQSSVRVTKSSSNKLDYGAELFVFDWNAFTETAGLGVFAALRI